MLKELRNTLIRRDAMIEEYNSNVGMRYANLLGVGLIFTLLAQPPLGVALLIVSGAVANLLSYGSIVTTEAHKLKAGYLLLPITPDSEIDCCIDASKGTERYILQAIKHFGEDAVIELAESSPQSFYAMVRDFQSLALEVDEMEATQVKQTELAAIDTMRSIYFGGTKYDHAPRPETRPAPNLPSYRLPVDETPTPRGNRRSLPTQETPDIWDDLPDNHGTTDTMIEHFPRLEARHYLSATQDVFDWSTITRRPHLFVLGDSGSGKTSLVQWLVTTHYPKNSEVLVLDPHDVKGQWGEFPTIGRGRNFDAVELALENLVKEMDRRYSSGTYNHPPQIVIIEEIPAIAANCKTAMGSIASLTLEARKVKIFLIVLSQGWEVDSLGLRGRGSVRDSFCFISLGEFAKKRAAQLGISSQIKGVDRPCFVGDELATVPELDGYVLAKQPDIRSSLDRLYQSATAPEPTPIEETPKKNPSKIDSLSEEKIDELLGKILNYAKKKERVKPSDINANIRAMREYSAIEIMQLFNYLEGDGLGVVRGNEFIPD